jgi:tetratricopeptide (TPR) repeat protein
VKDAALAALNRYREALDFFHRALALDPENVDAERNVTAIHILRMYELMSELDGFVRMHQLSAQTKLTIRKLLAEAEADRQRPELRNLGHYQWKESVQGLASLGLPHRRHRGLSGLYRHPRGRANARTATQSAVHVR